jgi:hypothetical protein
MGILYLFLFPAQTFAVDDGFSGGAARLLEMVVGVEVGGTDIRVEGLWRFGDERGV